MANSLKKLLETVLEDDDEAKVVDTWPMTKEEKKMHGDLIRMARDHAKEEHRLRSQRQRFWADIQDRINEYGSRLHINAKKGVIEKMEGGCDDIADAAMSGEDDE